MESKRRHLEPFYYAGNATGILLIHGLPGSPSEMRFLGERLAAEGWTVLGIRLSGHGSTREELKKASWQDWVQDAEKGVNQLRLTCKQVIGVGLSMGGLIALHLASKGILDGLITMNAPLIEADWGERLDVTCVESLNKAIRQVSQEIHQIEVPTLLLQSTQDKIVDPINVHRIQEHLTRTLPEVVFFEKSGHILSLGPEREEVAVSLIGFIHRLEKSGY